MEKNLIYDFNEHGLYYEKIHHVYIEKEILLTISDTIELSFDYDSGNLISVGGFLPLVKAIKKEIKLSNYIEGEYSINTKNIQYLQGVGYDYFDFFKKSERYFIEKNLPIVYYDEKNKRILIGTQDSSDKCIKVDKNIYCGFEENNNLKYLLLSLDKVILCS